MPAQQPYIGRFAPSPTGPLHLGSLFTALASFLQARARQGKWLLRIDDLDTPRNAPGSIDSILTALDTLGLYWDDEVDYQSRHVPEYEYLLDKLLRDGLIYPCTCTRKSLSKLRSGSAAEGVYPGICKNRHPSSVSRFSLRIKTDDRIIAFDDQLQGSIAHGLAEQHGDFIVKRRDGIIAYQFAVVVDDARQHVSHVVRGFDLLNETPKQIFLQDVLSVARPGHMHVPVIVDQEGLKLSKQTLAAAVELNSPETVLHRLLVLLGQNPPSELHLAPAPELIDWAITHWNPAALKNLRAIRAQII